MFEAAAAVVVVVVETVGAAAAAEVVAVAVAAAAAGALAVPATAEIEIVEVLEVVVGAGAVAAAVATSAAEPPRRPPPAGRRRPTSHSCRELELALACGQQRWRGEQQLKKIAVMIKLSMMTENVDEGQLPALMLLQSPQVFGLCRASAATPSLPPQFAVAPARWRCPADWWSQSRRRRRRPRF